MSLYIYLFVSFKIRCLFQLKEYCHKYFHKFKVYLSNMAILFLHEKRMLCLRHDLPLSVINRVISIFQGEFIFTKLCICEFRKNKTLTKISEFKVSIA